MKDPLHLPCLAKGVLFGKPMTKPNVLLIAIEKKRSDEPERTGIG
tara:strand:- start:951 stop:1085 length:135 start_codon:yes stop_codon:yes gene_type:complete